MVANTNENADAEVDVDARGCDSDHRDHAHIFPGACSCLLVLVLFTLRRSYVPTYLSLDRMQSSINELSFHQHFVVLGTERSRPSSPRVGEEDM
jgi:hypothetical protein